MRFNPDDRSTYVHCRTAKSYNREPTAQLRRDRDRRLGGTCTNDGCVPTRVMAKAARLLRDSRQFDLYGINGTHPTLNFTGLIQRTQQVVYQVEEKKQLLKHLSGSNVTVFTEAGNASFTNPYTIRLADGRTLHSRKFILCVGGQARRLGFPGAEHAMTHNDVWNLKSLPKSIVIVGASATGCQLASIFSSFDTQVWLLDIADHILPTEDEQVSQVMREAFENRGVRVITGIQGVERIEKPGEELSFYYTADEIEHRIDTEAVILAVGWPGNLTSLNLKAAGVETQNSFIPVDAQLRTNVRHIYAAGDITGNIMLVQSASYEARIAAENAYMGERHAYRHQNVPHGGFTDPEYGSVGMTEIEARRLYDCAVAVIPYKDLDRAVIDDRTVGFCKLIAARDSGRVLGAHVVGEQALEIVQIVAAGMAAKIKCDQLADLELAYPTFTAIVGLAARKILGELEMAPQVVQWGALSKLPAAEWERHER